MNLTWGMRERDRGWGWPPGTHNPQPTETRMNPLAINALNSLVNVQALLGQAESELLTYKAGKVWPYVPDVFGDDVEDVLDGLVQTAWLLATRARLEVGHLANTGDVDPDVLAKALRRCEQLLARCEAIPCHRS